MNEETMSAARFQEIRENAGLSLRDLGRLLRYRNVVDLRQIERGARPISGPIQVCMEQIAEGKLSR